jgi:hypothetical protein
MFSEPFEDCLEGFEGRLLGLPGVSQGCDGLLLAFVLGYGLL